MCFLIEGHVTFNVNMTLHCTDHTVLKGCSKLHSTLYCHFWRLRRRACQGCCSSGAWWARLQVLRSGVKLSPLRCRRLKHSSTVPGTFFSEIFLGILGPCVWGRGRPWYGTSAQPESHVTCFSPRRVPRVAPSTFLLNYFWAFLGPCVWGRGRPCMLGVLSDHLQCEMKSPHLVDFSWDLVEF